MVISSREHATPMVISSKTPDLMEMSILVVGEILAILTYSKVYGERIGLLNQSICSDGRKYLVLTTYMDFWLEGK